MQQIAHWLEKLGLGQYAQRFAENDIDFEILSDLTDQDLEKVGVTSLGIAESYCVRLPLSKASSRSHPPLLLRHLPHHER
jgi:hypothetical protein